MYTGINLAWNYVNRTCRLTMDNYTANLLLKFGHTDPKNLQHSPYKHTPIQHGSKFQYANEIPNSLYLNYAKILRAQSILGSLLYYTYAVDNKLLVALSELVQQQASATEATKKSIEQLLDYVTTYPKYGINFRASGLVLARHSDAVYLNFSKARS